jgi:hypothetical protein
MKNKGYFNAEVCHSCETVCPYCGETEPYTGDGLQEDETVEQECGKCKKTFLMTASVSVSHHCWKQDKDIKEKE